VLKNVSKDVLSLTDLV